MAPWIPLLAALVLGLGLIWVNSQHAKFVRTRSLQYRRYYIQIIAKCDRLVAKVNQMQELLPFINDSKVVDYYENCLNTLETLLAAIVKLPRFGHDLTQLKTAHHLVVNCQAKVARTWEAFRRVARGRSPDYNKLFDWKSEQPDKVRGCYFCSKPYRRDIFAKVNTKINDVTIEVYGCSVCREELTRSKKVKVLYFMKNGQPVHWSQVPEYEPSENYWQLNNKSKIFRETKLELVSMEDANDRLK